jgi:hypothetical protein
MSEPASGSHFLATRIVSNQSPLQPFSDEEPRLSADLYLSEARFASPIFNHLICRKCKRTPSYNDLCVPCRETSARIRV